MSPRKNKETKLFIPTWTDEKTRLLEQFFNEGCSASTISYRLGAKGYKATKNAVIGKLHRIGLSGTRKKTKDKAAPQRIKKTRIFQVPPPPPIVPKPRRRIIVPQRGKGTAMIKPPDTAKRVLLREAKEGECRAIIGYLNGIMADAVCCGEPTISKVVSGRLKDSSWCEFHDKEFTVEGKR